MLSGDGLRARAAASRRRRRRRPDMPHLLARSGRRCRRQQSCYEARRAVPLQGLLRADSSRVRAFDASVSLHLSRSRLRDRGAKRDSKRNLGGFFFPRRMPLSTSTSTSSSHPRPFSPHPQQQKQLPQAMARRLCLGRETTTEPRTLRALRLTVEKRNLRCLAIAPRASQGTSRRGRRRALSSV